MWTDHKADALAILASLPKMLGDEPGSLSYVRFADWMRAFGPRRDPPMTPEDIRLALQWLELMARDGEGAPDTADLWRRVTLLERWMRQCIEKGDVRGGES